MTLQFIALNWRQRTQSRAQVRLAIEDFLDAGLPRAYTPELYHRKCSDLFEHIYERYLGEGTSVYRTTPRRSRTGRLASRGGRLKRLQAETAAELDALLPSILDRAFKGEL